MQNNNKNNFLTFTNVCYYYEVTLFLNTKQRAINITDSTANNITAHRRDMALNLKVAFRFHYKAYFMLFVLESLSLRRGDNKVI